MLNPVTIIIVYLYILDICVLYRMHNMDFSVMRKKCEIGIQFFMGISKIERKVLSDFTVIFQWFRVSSFTTMGYFICIQWIWRAWFLLNSKIQQCTEKVIMCPLRSSKWQYVLYWNLINWCVAHWTVIKWQKKIGWWVHSFFFIGQQN